MKICDLTLSIEEGMTTFPRTWHPTVEVSQIGRHHVEGRETRKIVLGTHTGTHIDAPLHMICGGDSLDSIDLEDINGRAIAVDLSDAPPLTAVEVSTLVEKTAKYRGDIRSQQARLIVLAYGWYESIYDESYYKSHPFLSLEAARWLIDSGFTLVGMDTPSPDHPAEMLMPVHKLLLENNVTILEYLTRTDRLPFDREFSLVVAPLKIKGGDGAPARAFAILD